MEKEWYVVNTYSGHESKVKEKIETKTESMGMQDYIYRVIIPETTEVEVKDGVKKEKTKKMFPGYILVEMVMSDEAWYIVRNTRGVTGFVGPGSKPVPLTDEEVENMGIEQQQIILNYAEGDSVKIKFGPLADFVGIVDEISMEKKKVRVVVSMFGRETPVELEFNQVEVV